MNGLFWSAGGSIIPNWQDKMLSTKQDGILSSNEMLDIKHRNLYWNARTRLSKTSAGGNSLPHLPEITASPKPRICYQRR